MINISEDYKIEIVHKLIEILKEKELNNVQKKTLYDIVMNLEKKTDSQKNRFIMYYNLDPNQKEKYNLTSLGKRFSCTSSAIKYSVLSIRHELVKLDDSIISKLKELIQQLKE